MKNKFIVYGVVDHNKNLIIDQTSFYSRKDMATSVKNEMNKYNKRGVKLWDVEKFILTRSTKSTH